MSDDERSYFANMSEDDFAAYIEELEQQYQEEQQEQQEKAEEEMEQDENNAYAAYNYGNGQRGRRHLFESIQTICNTCAEKCVDDDEIEQSQEYYEEMEKLFEEAMCVQSGDGSGYIGHTCGSNGKSIELALFTDENCMYMAGEQNAYSLYQQAVAMTYGDGDADGDGEQDYDWNPDDLAYGYMNMVTEMFSDEYSCQMGAVRSYDGAVSSYPALFESICLVLSSSYLYIFAYVIFRHYRIPVKPAKTFTKTPTPRVIVWPTCTTTRTKKQRRMPTPTTTTTTNTNTTATPPTEITTSLKDMTWFTVKILPMCVGLFLSLRPTWLIVHG